MTFHPHSIPPYIADMSSLSASTSASRTSTSQTSNSQLYSRSKTRFPFRAPRMRSSLPSTSNSQTQNPESAINVETALRSGSNRKAAQILGLSEEAVRRGRSFYFERNLRRFDQITAQPEHIRGKLSLKEIVKRETTTCSGRSRALSASAALPPWTRKSDHGESTEEKKARRNSAPASAANNTHSGSIKYTKLFSQSLRRRPSVVRVLEKVRSVKRRFTGPSSNAPAFQEDEEDFYFDLGEDRNGLSLQFPPHISQDKSEIDYIRRKNNDARLSINSDVVVPSSSEDDEDWTAMENRVPVLSPENRQRVSTSSSTFEISPAAPLTPTIKSSDLTTTTNSQKSINEVIGNTEMWNEVEWHLKATTHWNLEDVAPHDTSLEGSVAEEEYVPRTTAEILAKFRKPHRDLKNQENISKKI